MISGRSIDPWHNPKPTKTNQQDESEADEGKKN
jgi:hypothetical protein